MQQFLLPDQTPPILEAEMALRAEQLINNSKHIVAPDPGNRQETRREATPEPPQQQQDTRSERSAKTPRAKQEKERIEEVKQVEKKEEGMEERQEPEGRQADTSVTEHGRKEVCCKVIYNIKCSWNNYGLFTLYLQVITFFKISQNVGLFL